YQLRYADRDMAVVKDRKRERVVPAEEGQEVVFPASTVYPVTERGERKATGSYYTPGYIVKYIVENTLGPLVDEKQRAIQERLTGLEAKLKAARGKNRELLERELGRVREGFGEAVLDLKVLDPAMGSGHFLVEATDYLAQRILDFGVRLGAGAEGGEGADETEISYWRRRAVESCIYGVDVNPLAVELAKLSLWLATAAKGKPLSFLDHHLRCGNSLIGACLADLGGLPSRKKRKQVAEEQMTLFDESAFTRDMGLAVGGLATIQELASDSVEDIHQKERIFEELLEVHLKRWRQIADLWASAYFGNEMAPEDYAGLVQWVQTGRGMLPDTQAQPYLDRAHALWREKRFFHWELEFPEVFFDQYGRRKPNPGFDAGVGNPPYVDVRAMDDQEKLWLFSLFSTITNRTNSFIGFIERGLKVLHAGGHLSLIVPNTLLSSDSYEKCRRLLLDSTLLTDIVDIGANAFVDATVETCIFVTRKEDTSRISALDHRVTVWELDDELTRLNYTVPQHLFTTIANCKFVLGLNEPTQAVIQSIRANAVLLGTFINTHNGINPGNASATLIVTEPFDPRHRKVIDGASVSRYSIEWFGKYILYDRDILERARDESIFLQPKKIVLQKIGRGIIGSIDDSQLYTLINTTIITPLDSPYALEYLLSVLNSRLINWYYSALFYGVQIKGSFLEQMPIRRISFTTPQEEREWLVEEGLQRYEAYLEHGEDVSVRAFVAARLLTEEEPEQSDVVHDLLAHLAEQMIAMNKEKQAEARGFLSWLADYTGLPVEDWTLKTSLKAYHQHDWAEMRRVLDRNRRKITKVNVKGREASEQIRMEWDDSVEKLQPLLARIAATDRLIDLIVYRLYGLTEEEVGMVEGH
nr:N-6 DNA methylase [Anaerolineales bacterium]